MAEEIIEQGYRELADTILEHNPGVDLGRVRAAFELADRAHSGQKRKAGTPYVTHCVAAAQICAEMGLDEDSIVAALLHDCSEDTAITHEDIARQFGAEVADIVEGVTKLTRVQFTSREDEQMENLRKMLMAMAKDIRVILIKIADRLHNMRTMEYMVTQKQLEKSLETMEIYAPIAHRLGLQKVKWELEDLSLKYLDPDGYREIITYLDSKADVLNKFMSDVEKKITDVAQKIYGADGVDFTDEAKKKIAEIKAQGYNDLPVIIAKTQYSLSDNAELLGRPTGFRITVRDVVLKGGAGFIVAIAGKIMLMPGLGAHPAAEKIDLLSDGTIVGLS